MMMRLGSDMGFAARLITDAATMEVGTGISEMTGVSCPSETEVLAIGSNCSSLFCLAFSWKVVRATTPKAISSLALLRGLR